MATGKQKAILDQMSENVRISGKLLEQVGYAPSTCEQVSRTIAGKGLQQLVETAESIGLNDALCCNKLKEAIEKGDLSLAKQTAIDWLKIKTQSEKTEVTLNIANIQQAPTIEAISNEETKQAVIDLFEREFGGEKEKIIAYTYFKEHPEEINKL